MCKTFACSKGSTGGEVAYEHRLNSPWTARYSTQNEKSTPTVKTSCLSVCSRLATVTKAASEAAEFRRSICQRLRRVKASHHRKLTTR